METSHPMRTSTFATISVIVPLFNGEQFIAEALATVLSQTVRPLEIFVVDDGSIDHGVQIARSFAGVEVLQKPHTGLAATLNYGVHHAKGELLAFLDADDRWVADKLAWQVAALADDPAVAMIFGYCRQFTQVQENDAWREVFISTQPGVSKSGMLIRRHAWETIGEFSEADGKHDFLDWYARAMELGIKSRVLEQILFERRVHDQNMGRRVTEDQQARYLLTLRHSLLRRRQGTEA